MKPGPRPLADLQAALMDALHDPRDVDTLDGPLRGASNQPVGEALSIYRQSMHSSQLQALQLTYPVTEALVGREFFSAVAKGYVQANPSRHGDLDHYGADYHEHLERQPSISEWPWLAEVARLEWKLHHLHRGRREPPLARSDLAGMDMTRVADLSFRLVRQAALFESPWPVVRLWLAHRDRAEDPDLASIDAGADRVLLSAMDPLRVIALAPASWAFFSALERGESLVAAVSQACAIDDDFDLQTPLAQALDAGALKLSIGTG